ncbi:MAG: hypothetical protein IKJ51_07190, partial [Clostridia bacterium]|nr:hypothetical protein [Clostridia bacterium]MBR6810454.1 hypothetical protein [Clostridia bacterium]
MKHRRPDALHPGKMRKNRQESNFPDRLFSTFSLRPWALFPLPEVSCGKQFVDQFCSSQKGCRADGP